jgi:hypothetical protein
MRGLDARCALAMARVLAPLNQQESEYHAVDAYMWAQDEGYQGHADDEPMPAFFVDEPVLIHGWNSGRYTAAWTAEIARCPQCQDPRIEMCSTHD